jgi:hypothetical protein
MLCGSCKNRYFGGMYHLHHQGDKNQWARNNIESNQQPTHTAKKSYVCIYSTIFLCSVYWLLVIYNIPSALILVILMLEAQHSSETSVVTRATRRDIQEDGIIHSHHRENFKSYMSLFPLSYIQVHVHLFFHSFNIHVSIQLLSLIPAPLILGFFFVFIIQHSLSYKNGYDCMLVTCK